MEPVDEFQGKAYLSKEVGARYLVNHTPRASYCVCAEGTGFRKGWIEAGKAFFKITVYGGGAVYTPYLARPFDGPNPNATIRAIPILERIEEWALEYEHGHRYESPGGTIEPRVNIGAIRGGEPSMILQNPDVCLIYVDVRTVPEQATEEIGFELRNLLEQEGVEGRVEQFVNRPSYEASGSSRSPMRSTRRTGTSSAPTARSQGRPSAACGATTSCSTRSASRHSPTGR